MGRVSFSTIPKHIGLLLIACGLILVGFAQTQKDCRTPAPHISKDELLYMPSKAGLQFISFGYKQALADVLWLSTVNYFGRHFASDKKYIWLAHMCGLVLELDPKALPAARFCSAMLSWEADAPEESEKLLTAVLEKNKTSWELFSLRGFTRLLFLEKNKEAGEDFRKAAAFRESPVLIKRLSTRDLATSNPEHAIAYILELLKQAGSSQEKRALEERLREAVFASLAFTIETAAQQYHKQHGRFPTAIIDLETAGLLHIRKLEDPFGGQLSLDPQSGKLKSSKWKKKTIGANEKSIDKRMEAWKAADKEAP